MRDFRDAKAMAHSLREALKAKSVSLTHSESLELVARTLGLPDWNHLAARIQSSQPPVATDAVTIPAGAGIPIVPMRDLVVFPQMVAPIFVGREKTRRAIERALATDRRVLVVTQRRSADDDPQLDALYAVGVTAAVINCVTLTDGTLKLAISGLERAAVGKPVADEFLAAEIAPIAESNGQTDQAVLLSRLVLDAYRMFANVDYSHVPPQLQARLHLPDIGDPSLLADTVAPLLPVSIEQRQQLLETQRRDRAAGRDPRPDQGGAEGGVGTIRRESAAALFRRHGDHADSRCGRRLPMPPALVIFAVRSSIPGGRCSQGGVKVPTGGKGDVAQARERLLPGLPGRRVSRFGVIPKPTVKVRMKENGCGGPRFCVGQSSFRVP